MTWHEWTQAGINKIPRSAGVYAITRKSKFMVLTTWIYVGRTTTRDDLRARVKEHYDGDSHKAECIGSKYPSHVGYEVISSDVNRSKKEKELIDQHKPACND